MDKKSIVVVVLLGILLIGIIVGVFVYDGVVNTCIVEVNGIKYNKSDFESYVKLWQYENGTTPVNMDKMFDDYKVYKLYSQYVDKYEIELPSGNQVKDLTDSEITKLTNDYNLSESEYMRVKTEITKVDYLFDNLQDYWIVSDEEYETHKSANEELFKMYDYRVMQVNVEQPEEESGDVSGDAVTNVSGESVSGDNGEQARKDAAKSRAVEALARVKSGDNFEEVAKEYGKGRFTYSNGGYSFVNGTLETVSGLYMEDYIWYPNVIDALTTLNKGEYSEIYEEENSYTFVYLENVREGLDEADKNTFKRQIANEHIQGEASILQYRITFKTVKLEDLVPVLTRTNESGDSVMEEHNHEHDHVQEEISGETISGDAN